MKLTTPACSENTPWLIVSFICLSSSSLQILPLFCLVQIPQDEWRQETSDFLRFIRPYLQTHTQKNPPESKKGSKNVYYTRDSLDTQTIQMISLSASLIFLCGFHSVYSPPANTEFDIVVTVKKTRLIDEAYLERSGVSTAVGLSKWVA